MLSELLLNLRCAPLDVGTTSDVFSSCCPAFTISDKDKNDSCSMGFHHAVIQMAEHLIGYMTMILSQDALQ